MIHHTKYRHLYKQKQAVTLSFNKVAIKFKGSRSDQNPKATPRYRPSVVSKSLPMKRDVFLRSA